MDASTSDESREKTGTNTVHRRIASGDAKDKSLWVAQGLFWLLVVASILIRLYNLHSPLLEVHHFRQTQTAFTVWCFLHQGIDLMHPMVPVLGPPWILPMEFPIFQATATLLIRLTGIDIDAGCRLTNILYFYASAGLLYLLAKKLFQRRSTAVWVLLFYLWSPFAIVWSRTSMIEFAAGAFSLGYVYFTVLWLERRRNFGFLVLATLMGCLGALTKITSMVAVVPLMLAFPTAVIWNGMRRNDPTLKLIDVRKLGGALAGQWLVIVAAFMLYIIPVAVGRAWFSYGDNIKAASLTTRFLSTANQTTWDYGTLDERLTADWWRLIFFRVGAYVTPFAIMALPIIALVVVRKAPAGARVTLYAALIGAILPPMVFFNLYHEHDYYLCAVLPMIALLAGYGLDFVVRQWVVPDWRKAIPMVAAAAISWFIAYDYISPAFTISYDNAICQLGKAIDDVTGPNDCVVVADWDWSPSILYYAKRRGYMVRPEDQTDVASDVRSLPFLRDSSFTTLVCRQQHPWFNIWPGLQVVRRVGPFAIVKIKTS